MTSSKNIFWFIFSWIIDGNYAKNNLNDVIVVEIYKD